MAGRCWIVTVVMHVIANSRQQGVTMTEPEINELAGVFEIHPMDADAFCEYLITQGIVYDERPSQLSQWIDAPEENAPPPDRVYVHIAQPERLQEILKLYRSWRGSAAGPPVGRKPGRDQTTTVCVPVSFLLFSFPASLFHSRQVVEGEIDHGCRLVFQGDGNRVRAAVANRVGRANNVYRAIDSIRSKRSRSAAMAR
jgi:hypothetical protein